MLVRTKAATIRNAADQVVTSVVLGTTVHDFVAVAGSMGAPIPGGSASIDWFTNGTCTGTPAASSGSVGQPLPDAVVQVTFDPRARRPGRHGAVRSARREP